MSRNPIAKALRSPHLRQRIVADKREARRMVGYRDLQAQLVAASECDDDAEMDRLESLMTRYVERAR